MKKICVVTGSRAEYGLLYWLLKEIQATPEFDLQIAATGMHLSPEFGSTYQKIENDGFINLSKAKVAAISGLDGYTFPKLEKRLDYQRPK